MTRSCTAWQSRSPLQSLARSIYANGHTKKEARRVLRRHLSDVVYRRMIRDMNAQLPDQSLLAG